MKDAVKNAASRTLKFADRHRTAIAVTVTAVTTVVLMDKLRGSALNDHLEFLTERGLENDYLNWIVDNSNV